MFLSSLSRIGTTPVKFVFDIESKLQFSVTIAVLNNFSLLPSYSKETDIA